MESVQQMSRRLGGVAGECAPDHSGLGLVNELRNRIEVRFRPGETFVLSQSSLARRRNVRPYSNALESFPTAYLREPVFRRSKRNLGFCM